MQTGFKTPILFLIYNRPEITRITFTEIAKLKPKKLYIAADGPKDQGQDFDRCQKARSIVNSVDWDCDLQLIFSEKNLGCKEGIISGINGLFKREETGIILEDDCLPAPDFFRFCEELLDYYRTDTRIMQISGSNYNHGWKRDDYSYYFSKYCFIHGWATWRRAWNLYDKNMSGWEYIKDKNYYHDLFPTKAEAAIMFKKWNMAQNGKIDTWDSQWLYTIMINSGLSITPNKNMMRNIGFSEQSTHTKSNPLHDVQHEEMKFPLAHPPFVFDDILSGQRYIYQAYQEGLINKLKGISRRLTMLKYELERDIILKMTGHREK